MPRVDDLFQVAKGKGGYIRDFGLGNTPLVSATVQGNGVVGLVDDAPKFKAPAITVERVTGSAFVQLVDFSTVPDDISVLVPKQPTELDKLYVFASVINNSRWRFSFGRKLTPTRLKRLIIPDLTGKPLKIVDLKSILISERFVLSSPIKLPQFVRFKITELFNPIRGDFHSLSRLIPGDIPTVSRVSGNNGVVGYFKKPSGAKLYPPLSITISTVTGDAFVQLQSFIATDNVLILIPKSNYEPATLFFIQAMLNRERWRCTYGRQLYQGKFRKTIIPLPAISNGQLDEPYMASVMNHAPYWYLLESYVKSLPKSIPQETTPQMEMTFDTTTRLLMEKEYGDERHSTFGSRKSAADNVAQRLSAGGRPG